MTAAATAAPKRIPDRPDASRFSFRKVRGLADDSESPFLNFSYKVLAALYENLGHFLRKI